MAGKNASTSRAKAARHAVARMLATKHFELEPGMTHIFRLEGKPRSAAAGSESIALLEVNENTVPAGIMPLQFGATETIPYSTVIVEITPAEFEKIKSGELKLYPREG